jgi:N-acetylneuraminic acid mutarotase
MDMPTPRWSLSTVVVNRRIYVLGGIGEKGDFLATMEVYDPIADKWTQLPEMPKKRVSFSTSVVREKMMSDKL